MINGNNAAQFTVSDLTANAQMWYTTDGSDPTNAAPSVGPVASGTTLSLQFPGGASNLTFKVVAYPHQLSGQRHCARGLFGDKLCA